MPTGWFWPTTDLYLEVTNVSYASISTERVRYGRARAVSTVTAAPIAVVPRRYRREAEIVEYGGDGLVSTIYDGFVILVRAGRYA